MIRKHQAFLLFLSLIFITGSTIKKINDDAENAYKKGDYEKAFKIWEPLAELGNAKAQFFLGTMYYYGEGVARNYRKGFKWWSRSAELGNPNAQFSLGGMYYYGDGVRKDYIQAYKWASISISNGYKKAISSKRVTEAHLTQIQVRAAQRLAKDWLDNHKD